MNSGNTHRPLRVARTLLMSTSLAVGLLTLHGCASPPPQPESMRDPQANFSAYKTFGWNAASATDPAADQPLLLLDSNIRAALKAELTRKGYVEVPAGAVPDLRIVYEMAKADKIENNPVRIGVGIGGWGGNTG